MLESRLDAEASNDAIIEHMEGKLVQYLDRKRRRAKGLDERVHVCLWLIVARPFSNPRWLYERLPERHLALMRRFSEVTTVVPVLTKCDTLPLEDLKVRRSAIR